MKLPTKPLENCEITISLGSIQVESGAIQYGDSSFMVYSKELPKYRNELTRDEMKKFLKIQLPKVTEKDVELFIAEFPPKEDFLIRD